MADVEFASEQDHYRLLLEISNAIGSILQLPELFLAISKILRPIFHHDGETIGIYPTERNQFCVYVLD